MSPPPVLTLEPACLSARLNWNNNSIPETWYMMKIWLATLACVFASYLPVSAENPAYGNEVESDFFLHH